MSEALGEMLDTSPEARSKYYALLRQLTPEQRARKVVSLCRIARMFAIAGIRDAHPEAGPDEIRRLLAVRHYGSDLVGRLFGDPKTDAR